MPSPRCPTPVLGLIRGHRHLIGVCGMICFLCNVPLATGEVTAILPSTAVADVTGDGTLEVIQTDPAENTLSILFNDDTGTVFASYVLSVGLTPRCVIAVNLDGDRALDLVTANEGDNSLTLVYNSPFGIEVLLDLSNVGTNPVCVAGADINGDGKPDLVTANHGETRITLLLNDANGAFETRTKIDVQGTPRYVLPVDLNGDGRPDLVTANDAGPSPLTVLLNLGQSRFSPVAMPQISGQFTSVAAADVNGDRKPDLIAANYSGTNLVVLTNSGSGSFGFATPLEVGPQPTSVVAGDFNGDGMSDLLCESAWGVVTLMNCGGGVFIYSFPPAGQTAAQPVAVLDADGDGKTDVAFLQPLSNGLKFLTQLDPWSGGGLPTLERILSLSTASTEPPLSRPNAVAVSSGGNVYVLANDRIVKFNIAGEKVLAWGGPGEFSTASGIALDSSENVYVADKFGEWIHKFSSSGTILGGWLSWHPSAITIDMEDNVYVADSMVESTVVNHWGSIWETNVTRVPGARKFSRDGVLLQQYPLSIEPFIQFVGVGTGTSYPTTGITVDSAGRVYVGYVVWYVPWFGFPSTFAQAGVEMFTTNEVYSITWGAQSASYALSVDSEDQLHVIDPLNHQLLLMPIHAVPRRMTVRWGITGGAVGSLSSPQGIGTDRQKNYFCVADTGNNRVLVFAHRPPLRIRPAGRDGALISWSGFAFGYALEQTRSLESRSWAVVTNEIRFAESEHQVLVPSGPGKAFYRLSRR